MTLLAWIGLGLIAGLVARTCVVRGVAARCFDCVLMGSVGALLGGSLFSLVRPEPAYGLVGAVAGAIALLGVCARAGWHLRPTARKV